MSAKLFVMVAVVLMAGVAGCSEKQKMEQYDKKHDLRDDRVNSLPDANADKPTTRPGMSSGAK
jgi:hypothetical protein